MSNTGSFAKELYCSKCGKTYTLSQKHQLCECGAPLLVRYDLEEAKGVVTADTFRDRPANLWRYSMVTKF